MTIAALIERYLQDRRRHNCRPNTLRHYRSRLQPLREQLGDRPLDAITRDELLDWLHAQQTFPDGTEKSPDTRRANVVCLSQLLKFAVDEGALAASPLRPKDLVKPTGRRRDRLPTPEEVDSILAVEGSPQWTLIYQALRHTGARPAELVAAQIEQIEATPAGRLLVIEKHKTSGKRSDPRKIPLGEAAAPWFDRAIGRRIAGPIFTDDRGRRWTVPRVSREFRRRRDALGLDPALVLYSARHEFGSNVAREVGIFQAKELLGHASIRTTERYSHLTAGDLIAAQNQAHAPTTRRNAG